MPGFEFQGRHYRNAAELAQEVIGGKWKMLILWRLKDPACRYCELKRCLGKVTHKMLTQQLRELERDGLIAREVFAAVPPRVEYSITPLGRTTVPAVDALREWGALYRRRRAE